MSAILDMLMAVQNDPQGVISMLQGAGKAGSNAIQGTQQMAGNVDVSRLLSNFIGDMGMPQMRPSNFTGATMGAGMDVVRGLGRPAPQPAPAPEVVDVPAVESVPIQQFIQQPLTPADAGLTGYQREAIAGTQPTLPTQPIKTDDLLADLQKLMIDSDVTMDSTGRIIAKGKPRGEATPVEEKPWTPEEAKNKLWDVTGRIESHKKWSEGKKINNRAQLAPKFKAAGIPEDLLDLWVNEGSKAFKSLAELDARSAGRTVLTPEQEREKAMATAMGRNIGNLMFDPEKAEAAFGSGVIQGKWNPWKPNIVDMAKILEKINNATGGRAQQMVNTQLSGNSALMDQIAQFIGVE